MGFKKFDAGKLRWRLLPLRATRKLLEVMEFGAKKYGDNNWRECDDLERYYDAALRHLTEWKEGVARDEESGLTHLAHASCCIMFLSDLENY